MIDWKSARLPILVTTFGGVFAVLAKLLIAPGSDPSIATPIVLPTAVPVQGWRSLDSAPTAPATQTQTELVTGRSYRYSQDGKSLEIELRYLAKTDADVKNLLLKYEKPSASVPFPSTLNQLPEIGSYSFFTDQTNGYLSSCINPRGESTVTEAQFTHNRYAYDLRPERVIPILLGQQTFQDSRCLWTYIKMPLNDASPEATHQILKHVWESWYEWWQPRFPDR